MKSEVSIKEIQEIIISSEQSIDFFLTVSLSIRALHEKWLHRVHQNERHYPTAFLPEDIKIALALKASTLPLVNGNKHLSHGNRHDQKVYREKKERGLAKSILVCAYVTYIQRVPHGQKGLQKQLFMENYNLGATGLLPDVYKLVGKVDCRGKAVEGWLSKLRKNNWNPMCLAGIRRSTKRNKRLVTPKQRDILNEKITLSRSIPNNR